MKARVAKKIVGCQWQNALPYWWGRVWDTLDGKCRDHRVEAAIRRRGTLKG